MKTCSLNFACKQKKEFEKIVGEISKKRLIFLMPSLAGGGAERVASILIPQLFKSDSRLVLLDNFIAYELPEHIKPIAFNRPASSPAVHILRIPHQVVKLARLIRKIRPAAVLSFMEQANIINLISSSLTGHTTILSQRTDPYRQYEYKGLLGRVILATSSRLYKRAEMIICVSGKIRDTLKRRYRIAPYRLEVIPNPLNEAPVDRSCLKRLDTGEHFILQVGRLNIKTKGQDLAVKAFSRLAQAHPSLNLVFAGKGPDRLKLQRLAKESGLEGRMIFTGWINDPRALMEKALFLIHPSRYEGWPNALAEALWCGCPVIASNCSGGGPKEMLQNGKCGMLIEPNDDKALEKAMRLLIEDGRLRAAYSEAGKKRARDFAPSKIAAMYEQAIYEAINRSSKGDSKICR